ncbi:hypothetical protein ASE95_11645 [Sphingomonas sp. Leaf231]|uniref:glycosyl hydrolase n=1 Tax=Sphingomonas sp. Leaf231 TaxID=1736301 RepID=UPI0006FDD0FC|nr:glycosyl hydrolase [Sphingomonas sp. Leaf231]KQN90933.1 hypothetical protein ASE95_11645 [Sphingomonas sp. Leaf231]
MLTSIYNAYSVADYLNDQQWAGGRLDAIQLHGGTAGWKDWLSSVQWQADMFANQDIDIMWSIPLIPYGATLGEAGAGKHDAKFLAMAEQLAANSRGDDKIYVRLGWEFNGNNWNSSSAVGEPENYVAAFRKFVDIARTVSDKFVFEWCPGLDVWDMNPEAAYPGDKYVDVIGVDMYYNTAWHNKDAALAFDWFVKQPYGLQWQQDFAAAHGKQTAVGEWGLNSDSPEFVKMAMQWMADHDMVYQNYWESNAAFKGELSEGQYKKAAAAYLSMLDQVAKPAGITITSAVDRALGANDAALTLTGNAIRGSGNAGDNVITGNTRDNELFGAAGNDKMYGGAGNDRLDGGAGRDTLVGGIGNDTYIVDNVGDKVVERAGEGTDTVYARVDYTLGANVENLYMVTGANKGTGNDLDNNIYGNAGNDTLKGMDGDDWLRGYTGDDALFGGAGRDTLHGHEGNDYLDGGTGADVMEGGIGDDTYVVDHVGDKVIEYVTNGQGGVDTVYSSIDYTLAANVEHLYLTGEARVGTGNNLANGLNGTAGNDTLSGLGGDDWLRGNAGNDQLFGDAGNDWLFGGAGDDRLDGGTGIDTMQGDGGNDTYIVDHVADVVVEAAGAAGGRDIVFASVSYALSANVEDLTLTGTAVAATGNALDNVIRGNAANNVITGGAGDDTLYGGGGADIFAFARGSGKDVIADFGRGDRIDLDAWHSAGAPTVNDVHGGALIDLGGGNSILVAGVTADHLSFTGGGFGFI